MVPIIVIAVVVIVLVLYLVAIFNNLVSHRNQYKNAFSQIEVQLKRRYDLIPNLVETAKSYMKHEQETLTAVIDARNGASSQLEGIDITDPNAIQALGKAEAQLSSSLGSLNFVMEQYPDLKANQNMMQVSEELSSTENKISFARQLYNDQVTVYNTYRQQFPNSVIASMFGHTQDGSLLEFEDSAKIQKVPQVKF